MQNTELVAHGAKFGLGEGIVQQLLHQFGPLVGKMILDWISKKVGDDSAFLNNLAAEHLGAPVLPGVKLDFGGDFVKKFLASMLMQHKAEVLAFVATKLDELYDKAVAALTD